MQRLKGNSSHLPFLPYEWVFSHLMIFMALIGSSLNFHYPFRDSWKKLGHMPQQKALECYIQELCEIDPEWEEKYAITDDLVSLKFMICICSHAYL